MDVKLPDGTVLSGVPDGTTQAQILQKLYESNHPAYKPLAVQMMKERPWGSGMGPAAYELGGKATDLATKAGASPEVAAGVGVGTNFLTQAIPTLASGFKFADAPPVSMAEGPAKWLMKSSVKPSQADRLSGASERAMLDMLREDISPTAGGMDKASKIARAIDQQAEGAIGKSPSEVSLNAVGSRLQPLARKAMTQVNPTADIDAIKSTWSEFKNSPLIQSLVGGGQTGSNLPAELGASGSQDISLPVKLAHELKKGTYASLGGKAYGEVGSVSTEAQKALARGLREEVASAVPDAAELLKREASLMNVKDVATNRALLEANNNPLGLGALRVGDNPLSTLGFVADRSAYLKGLLARLLYRGGQPQMIAPALTAGETVAGQQQQ